MDCVPWRELRIGLEDALEGSEGVCELGKALAGLLEDLDIFIAHFGHRGKGAVRVPSQKRTTEKICVDCDPEDPCSTMVHHIGAAARLASFFLMEKKT